MATAMGLRTLRISDAQFYDEAREAESQMIETAIALHGILLSAVSRRCSMQTSISCNIGPKTDAFLRTATCPRESCVQR